MIFARENLNFRVHPPLPYFGPHMNINIKKLSALEFRRILIGTRFNDQSRQILWAVLGEGRGQAEVADQFGVTRQRVNRLMGFFRTAYAAKAMASTAEVSATFELPSSLAIDLGGFLADYKASEDGTAKAKAVDALAQSLKQARTLLAGDSPA